MSSALPRTSTTPMRLPPHRTPPRHLSITHAAPNSSHPPSPLPPRLESPHYLTRIHHTLTEAIHHAYTQSSSSSLCPCLQHSQPPTHRRRTAPQTTTHATSQVTPQHQHGCPSGGSGLMGLKRKNRRAATSLKTLGPLITLLPECDELTEAGGAWSGLPARPLVVSRHDKVLSLG